MPTTSITRRWLFPPRTREVQFDEKWSFVAKKEGHRAPGDAPEWGDAWDHTAVDPEHRLLLAVVPGKRTLENCRRIVGEVQRQTAGRADLLLTSDEHAPYATAIEEAYHQLVPVAKRPGPGRPPKPKRVLPPELCYATVCKQRQHGRVVAIRRTLVFGLAWVLALLLARSTVSKTINTAFVERNNGTDRRQNGRKHRKTYGFSKDAATHDAATYFIGYSYNFCWAVRTLEIKDEVGSKQPRTPAMAAGLANHVWSLQEWLTYPAKPC
jgi:IS1 family transposase